MEKNYVIMYEGEYGIKLSTHHTVNGEHPKRYRHCDASRMCNRLNRTARVRYFAAHESQIR